MTQREKCSWIFFVKVNSFLKGEEHFLISGLCRTVIRHQPDIMVIQEVDSLPDL